MVMWCVSINIFIYIIILMVGIFVRIFFSLKIVEWLFVE